MLGSPDKMPLCVLNGMERDIGLYLPVAQFQTEGMNALCKAVQQSDRWRLPLGWSWSPSHRRRMRRAAIAPPLWSPWSSWIVALEEWRDLEHSNVGEHVMALPGQDKEYQLGLLLGVLPPHSGWWARGGLAKSIPDTVGPRCRISPHLGGPAAQICWLLEQTEQT